MNNISVKGVNLVGVFLMWTTFLVLALAGCITDTRADVQDIAVVAGGGRQLLQHQLSGAGFIDSHYNGAAFADNKEDVNVEEAVEHSMTEQKDTAQTDIEEVAGIPEELFNQYADELNGFLHLSYVNPTLRERYIHFKIRKLDLEYPTVINWVNVGLDGPFYGSIQNIGNAGSTAVLVNKYNKLSGSYVPGDLEMVSSKYANGDKYLRSDAREQFERMCMDAEELGLNIFAVSAYRSYSTQKSLYDRYVARSGKKQADTYSARPGHSEHQTGLAVDVIAASSSANVDKTKEYKWYKDNAHHYGFIIRYPSGKSHITGYIYEPWHLRYLGVELATAVYNSGLTYDEYYARTRSF